MLKALIIDDESAARSELRYLLEKTQKIRVLGEAATAEEALELLKSINYDVVFLDIQMPQMTGTELARKLNSLDKKPFLVFVTAYGEYAVEAFELRADDYLVKPVSKKRLSKTVKRLQNSRRKTAAKLKEKPLDKIFVDLKDKKIPISIKDIYYFEAFDDYARLYTNQDDYLINSSLKSLQEKLLERNFVRVHRKYLVNMDKVLEVITLSRSAYLLKLSDDNKTEIPVSRRKSKKLRKLFEL